MRLHYTVLIVNYKYHYAVIIIIRVLTGIIIKTHIVNSTDTVLQEYGVLAYDLLAMATWL